MDDIPHKTFSFEKLIAYQESKALVVKVYNLLKGFPSEERYALCDQIRRAVVSVPSNIAEQGGRTSFKEKIHFLEIACGSLMETYCQLQIAVDLGYIDISLLEEIRPQFIKISQLLSGLRKRLQSGTSSLNPKL